MSRRNVLIGIGVLAAALIGLRLALPAIVKDYVNDTLHALEGYDGSIQDVDLHLWRGAYRIDGVNIVKTDSDQPTPFFSSEYLEFSVDWRDLLRGALVAEGEFGSPDINIVQAKSEEESQVGEDEDWGKQLGELFPFRIDEVRVRDGRVTYRAPGIGPDDALTIEQINGQVVNLTNVADSGKQTFAEFDVNGRVLNDAPLTVKGGVDPLAKSPTFDVNMTLERVELPKLNAWLRRFAKVDAEAGSFQMYIELAAADGKFQGYAKPLMQDVNILSSEEPEKNPLKRAWEGLVDVTAEVLGNDEEDQIGARIPLSGTIDNPDASIWATIVSVLHNGFVDAFTRSLEGSISLRSVRQSFSEATGGGAKGSEDREQKDKKKDERKKGEG